MAGPLVGSASQKAMSSYNQVEVLHSPALRVKLQHADYSAHLYKSQLWHALTLLGAMIYK